jgi:uncharacterized protein YggE
MKRLLLALVALLSFGGPAVAQALGAGEIALTIEVLGVADPDQATVSQTLRGRGADEAKAKADLAMQRAALSGALAKLGIPATAIKFGSVEVSAASADYAMAAASTASDAAMDAAAAATADGANADGDAAMGMPAMQQVATQGVTVTTSDFKRIADVVAAMPRDEEYYRTPQATYSTRDAAAAHTRAIANALTKARAEADAYAAALGMRVVRIARVSSEKEGINWPNLIEWFGKMDDNGSPSEDNFRRLAGSTFAGAKIEFVIAPK